MTQSQAQIAARQIAVKLNVSMYVIKWPGNYYTPSQFVPSTADAVSLFVPKGVKSQE